MPVQPTYPGVYLEEVPSGVRTITGVATSITAFVGRARSGPVNEPVTINNYGDFERTFGGLWTGSTLSYAVRDFYLNGGGQAVIVRLFHPLFADNAERTAALAAANDVAKAAKDSAAAADPVATVKVKARAKADAYKTNNKTKAEQEAADTVATAAEAVTTLLDIPAAVDAAVASATPVTNASLTVGSTSSLSLLAASPGASGNQLEAAVDWDVPKPDTGDLFNLQVRVGSAGSAEMFRNVSVAADHPRRVDKVLAAESKLVRAGLPLPAGRPTKTLPPATPTADPWAKVTQLASDGNRLGVLDFTGSESKREGLYALEKTDLFNLLCLPPLDSEPGVDMAPAVIAAAATYCEKRRAMLLVDPPAGWDDKDKAKAGVASIGTSSKNAALYFPRLRQPNPLRGGQIDDFAPCGAVAGVFARTDAQRGVWKAPAGLEATLVGVPALSVSLTDPENGALNALGINCLRVRVPVGPVVWGARTLQGDDRLASEWKYIPVRRLALYIEESLYRGTQWVVFEPNDERLWSQIRLNIGAFMQTLFRQSAFQGLTPREAYLVKCDRETTTQDDINRGVVNILVGFAPLKPAEFVIIRIQQLAGQTHTPSLPCQGSS